VLMSPHCSICTTSHCASDNLHREAQACGLGISPGGVYPQPTFV
jgi:hypothetical protein